MNESQNTPHVHGADAGERAFTHAHDQVSGAQDPSVFWENRYASAEAVWSGRVNRSLADLVESWEPGRSLDLGCGEGGDVLWLAEHGWDATGIDLSTTAIARATEHAASRDISNARFVAADLGEWAELPASIEGVEGSFDLVTASFLQSPVELPRERVLRAAAARVAPGGRLVIISHAAPPSWAGDHPGDFPSPDEELALLDLDAALWQVEVAETRGREITTPDSSKGTIDDTVVVVQRLN